LKQPSKPSSKNAAAKGGEGKASAGKASEAKPSAGKASEAKPSAGKAGAGRSGGAKSNVRKSVAPAPASAAGAGRHQRLLNGGKIALGLVLVLGTAAGTAFGAYRFAVSSPRFALSSLEISSSRRLSDVALARAAGIPEQANIFSIDLEAAEQKLLEDPWVRTVHMVRKLPDTLVVDLVEREAVALAALDGEVFLVDAAGEPFKRWTSGDPHDLPLITGIGLEQIAADRSQALSAANTALEVLEHYARLPVSKRHKAQEVHLSPDGSVILTVGTAGVALHLGKGPWPRKLLMVAEVLKPFERKDELPGVVFLDNQLHPERVVVRMR
jgi:cell division protein FtsQ